MQDRKLLTKLDKEYKRPNFVNLFKSLSARHVTIKRGSFIVREGASIDKIICIESGYVKLFRVSKGGQTTISYIYGANYLLGLRALTSEDNLASHTAEAISDTEILILPRKSFLNAIFDNPQYVVDLLYIFIGRLNYTEKRAEDLVAFSVMERVAAFLYDCLLRFGQDKGKMILIPIPLTHQLVSEFVGSARESTTIAINKLVKEGVITHTRGSITVLDKEKLKGHAGL